MSFEQPVGSRSGAKILRLVDPSLNYGPCVMQEYLRSLENVRSAVDIGGGKGRDLEYVRDVFPDASLAAIECVPENVACLEEKGITAYSLDIEKDRFPFQDESIDLVICNQVLEHVKELFLIAHEITRSLKVGGHFIVGVPNIASFHNRMGLLFGKHPTQAKACSAHIRCYSKDDFLLFLEECFPGGYSLQQFAGSQFYPFPPAMARPMAALFPTMAYSIFFLLQKQKKYTGSFLEYPRNAMLETNFRTAF